MFKKTDTHPQLGMFKEPSLHMGKRTSKKFQASFQGGQHGTPNASIRILVAMSILKEGFVCSDEDLFEKCEFDLLTRRALGLVSLDDVVPSLDTYYLFRRRICAYQEKHGVDLMQKSFEQVAGEQVRMMKISGKCVRMDSKLIGSNIAKVSRYELIHRTLTKFLKHKYNLSVLIGTLHEQAEAYLEEDPGKTVYHSDKDNLQAHNHMTEFIPFFKVGSLLN